MTDAELQDLRTTGIHSHYYTAGLDLVTIDVEDLGLPRSTRAAAIVAASYCGGMARVATSATTEAVGVEYTFDAEVEFEATVAASDAEANGWHQLGTTSAGDVVVRDRLSMTGTTSVTYEDDETTGYIEWVRVGRSDGTPPSPVGLVNNDAMILRFDRSARKRTE